MQTLSCLKFLVCVNNKYIIIGRPGSFHLLLKNCLSREISVSSQLMKEFTLSFLIFLFPSWGGGSCSESRSLLSLNRKGGQFKCLKRCWLPSRSTPFFASSPACSPPRPKRLLTVSGLSLYSLFSRAAALLRCPP